MKVRVIGALVLAASLILLTVDRAPAAVLCVSPHGLVRVRGKCRHKETPADPASLGLLVSGPQGPTGARGIPGPTGAVGPTGPPGTGVNLTCPGDPPGGTNLLFPFLTNTNGFDTGVAISNTGADPFGTVGNAGTCKLTFFGSGAPPPFTSSIVTPGTQLTFTMSTVAPGFQGYGIAQCAFQFAHGFAFVSDLGARNLAMGYLPLVVCSNRTAKPVEQLLP
jgi:hypothetical protein